MLKKIRIRLVESFDILHDTEQITEKEVRKVLEEEVPKIIEQLKNNIYARIEVEEEEIEYS